MDVMLLGRMTRCNTAPQYPQLSHGKAWFKPPEDAQVLEPRCLSFWWEHCSLIVDRKVSMWEE